MKLKGDDAVTTRLAQVGREFGHGFALGLDRIEAAMQALGRPQDRLPPTIHVAGTNGKGSTCAFLRAIAEAASLKAHVFTSPHLVRVNERIRLSGALVSDDALIDALDRLGSTGVVLTYFEALTAAALLLFSETPADVVILEVGLGGRHDATNVVRPAVSVIAPVDYDHQEFLGATLALIAGEKAGILKPGVPGVIARQAQEAQRVIEAEAERLGAKISRAGIEWDCWPERGGLVVQLADRLLDLPAPSLPGRHQFDNAGLAVAAIAALDHPRIDDAAIARGVASAHWPARMQRLREGPLAAAAQAAGATLWLDGAHNPHAAAALARTLADMPPAPTALIVGMLGTKDLDGFLAATRPLGAPLIAVPVKGSQAAVPPQDLAERAVDAGIDARAAENLPSALAAALARGAKRVVICGSLYLAGEALAVSGGVD